MAVVPSDNGGSTILGYQAQCVSSNGGVTVQNLTAGPSPRTVGLLDAGKSYQCQVRAVNAVGAGAWSAFSNTVNVPNVPGAPTNVVATPVATTVSTGSLSVAFVAPASNGGATITSYQAQCSSNGGSSWVPSTPTAGIPSPIVVPGLTTGVAGSPAYVCRVRAVNAAGAGPWSVVSGPVVVGSPAAPTVSLVQTTLTNGALGATVGQLQVTFTALSERNGGSPYTGFTARCTEVGTTNVLTATVGSAVTAITVGSAKVGVGYVCRVAAINARGTGVFANPPVSPAAVAPATDGRVIVGSPGRPTVTGVTAPSAGRLKVSFNPPLSNNGSNIVSFTARCVSTNGGVAGQFSGQDPNINYTILNLTSGKTYQCYVAATNSRGLGIWSLPSAAITVG
ncbi:MAG: fibronectin type III domain-containing protein [Actinomycetota bacterium]